MDQILLGMDMARCCIDDILIRTDPYTHFQVFDEVLKSLERHVIVAKWPKCEFMVPSVEFLGYRADGKGRHLRRRRLQPLRGLQAQITWQNCAPI